MSDSSLGRALLLATALGALTACSFTPERSALVPATYDRLQARHDGSVRVQVRGGSDVSFMEGINIPNEVFAGAVEDAIRKSRLFTTVLQRDDAEFSVDVALERLIRPTAGLTVESQLSALWRLRGTNPERVVWQDLIVTTGEASVSDAVNGVTRIRMAVERAARNNIDRALQEMSQLTVRSSERR